MTVAAAPAKAGPFTGNDVTSAFDFEFKVLADTDVRVVETVIATGVETDLVLNTDYTVVRNVDQDTDPGGTVTYKVGGVTTALPSTKKLTIGGNFSFVQPADIPNGGAFAASVIETALDRVTMLIKQLAESLTRTLTLPFSVSADVDATLPAPSANDVIAWNATADGFQNVSQGTMATVVAFGDAQSDVFSGDGVTTDFALTVNPGALNNLDVAIGGVTQRPNLDYTWVSGTLLSFVTAPPAGTNNILARYTRGVPQGTLPAGDAALVTAADGAVGTLWTTVQGFINKMLSSAGASLVGFIQSGTGAVATTVQDKLRETISVEDFGADLSATPAVNAAAITAAIDHALTIQPHPEIVFPELYNITGYTITINKPTIIGYPDPYYLTFRGTGGGIRKDDSGYIFTGANSISGFIRVQNMSFKSVRGAGTTVWNCNKLMYIDSSYNEYFAVDGIVYQNSDVNAELFQSSRFVNEHVKEGSGYAFLWKRAADIVIANCKFETRDSAIGNVALDPGTPLVNQNHTVKILNNVFQGLFLGEGTAIKLGNSWNMEITGNYTEINKKYIDLHSMVLNGHYGLTVENNSYYLSTAQKATVSGTYDQAGTTTITVTSAAHGLIAGVGVYIDFTSGTAPDGSYAISNVTTDTFDVTAPSAATTSGNLNFYYCPLVVGNLITMSTASLRSHLNVFGRNVSDGELFCFVGTGSLMSFGDYGFQQRGFNNKNIQFFNGRNTFTTAGGRSLTTSGLCKVFSFTQAETNLLAAEIRTVTINFSDTDITNPILLQNLYQVYPAQAGVNVLSILPTYATANSGTLAITIENRTAATIANVTLNIVCMQLAGY